MVNPYLSPFSDSQGIPQNASAPRSFTRRGTFVIALAGIVGSVLGSIMILLSQSAVRRCKVTIGVTSAAGPTVYLTGIVATEVRPGWITLNVPHYEQWEEPMRWLTRSQQERIESAEFFELLQREIPSRFDRQFE